MRHVVAIMLKWKEVLHSPKRQKMLNSHTWYLDMCLVQTAEEAVIRLCHRRYFEKDINTLHHAKSVSKQSSVCKLDLFLDEKDILQVGGRK